MPVFSFSGSELLSGGAFNLANDKLLCDRG